MTKKDIVDQIAKETGLDKQEVQLVIEALMTVIKDTVANGEDVCLRGFGTFTRKKRAFKNFHAAPGKWIPIPEHYIPVLKFSKDVLEAVKS